MEIVFSGIRTQELIREVLDEVVVVGYGVQKKINLTVPCQSVKGMPLKRVLWWMPHRGLQGMFPGLMVSSGNSGRPWRFGSLTLRG